MDRINEGNLASLGPMEFEKQAGGDLERQVVELKRKLELSAHRREQLLRELHQKQCELRDADLTALGLREELERRSAELEELQAMLQSILSSKSWKLTLPLRRLMTALRRS